MKHEKAFSKGGVYELAVQRNILLHCEAATYCARAVKTLLSRRKPGQIVNVLDLACGGLPITICQVIESFPTWVFNYTGIDINPDQVEKAKNEFAFPKNITKAALLEGDAWNLSSYKYGPYDVIYTGLNLHHGIAEEVFCLMKQIRQLLKGDGLFISHDMYRPSYEVYLKRPDANPQNLAESYTMISHAVLQQFDIPAFIFADRTIDKEVNDWRLKFLDSFGRELESNGASEDEVRSALDHVYQRDYPLSAYEMKEVIQAAGFVVDVFTYKESKQPLRAYYATHVAHLDMA